MASQSQNPLGEQVPIHPAKAPSKSIHLTGDHVTLTGLSETHIPSLWRGIGGLSKAPLWDYMFDSPFADSSSFSDSMALKTASTDPLFYAILLNNNNSSSSSECVGYCALMRIELPNRVCEVGNVMFAPSLQRSAAATEAMYLLARYVFEHLGFRRYEWKLNDLNAPSHRAARRLGFVYEGTFRRHMVVKGRNRDTAWYAMVEEEWVDRKRELEGWLGEGNFDERGVQKRRLEDFRRHDV